MRALTIFFLSLFSLPLVLNAQSVDEMLQKVSALKETMLCKYHQPTDESDAPSNIP